MLAVDQRSSGIGPNLGKHRQDLGIAKLLQIGIDRRSTFKGVSDC